MQHASVLALAAVCALLTTAGQVMLKIGTSSSALVEVLAAGDTTVFLMRAVSTPMVLAGLVLYGASAVLWLLVLARADVSFAFPLVSLGFVFTALYAHFALHEPVSLARIAGIGLIVAGVAVISRS